MKLLLATIRRGINDSWTPYNTILFDIEEDMEDTSVVSGDEERPSEALTRVRGAA